MNKYAAEKFSSTHYPNINATYIPICINDIELRYKIKHLSA